MNYSKLCRTITVGAVGLLSCVPQYAADIRRLTLTEAVHLAISQNRALKIARLKVAEKQQKKAGERSAYFPSITNQSNALYITDLQNIGIPAGTLGIAGGSLVPSQNVRIPQGQNSLFTSGTMIAQPLTQLIRIHQANRIAAFDVIVSRDDLKKAETQVALQVHNIYFGILIARLQKQAAEQQTTYAKEHLRESEDDVRNGSALRVAAVEGRAGLLEGLQSVLTADLQLSDLTTELDDLLGLPLDTQLELDPVTPARLDQRPREEFVKAAWAENPEVLAAEESIQKAKAAVTAARSAYLPDVTVFARHSYQDGVPFVVRNFGTFGVNLNWDLFDFGKRRATVRERETQLAEAEENLHRLKEEIAVSVERSYNKVERTKSMVEVANQVVALRKESERLAQNQLNEGVVLVSDRRRATADSYKAQAEFLQASLGYLLAWAELQQTIGRTPGF
jgi:outer membrane protein TolC